MLNSNLRRQFIIAMILTAILPLVTLFFGLYYFNIIPLLRSWINYNRSVVDQQFIVEQTAQARRIADELTEYFMHLDLQVIMLASVADNQSLPQVYRSAIIKEYINRFPGILYVHSTEGIEVGRSSESLLQLMTDITHGNIPLNTITDSRVKMSAPIQIPSLSDESIIVMQMSSVYGTESSMTILAELPTVSSIGKHLLKNRALMVVDQQGKLILKSESNEHPLGSDMNNLIIVNDFVSLGVTEKPYQYKIAEGSVVQGILAEVEPVGWGLVTEYLPTNSSGIMLEMESSFADLLDRLLMAMILGVISVGLLAGSIGALIAVRFTKPFKLILEGINHLRSGDFSYRFQVTGPEDTRRLSNMLNLLTSSLEVSTRKLKKHADQLRELFMGSVSALVTAIDAKDPYTRGHSRRVQIISLTLGRQMGLTTDELTELEVSALMHDIGKLGVDELLLRKPGLLTTSEREALEQHPVFGAEIMRHIPMFKNMLPGMLHHHERWDGSGYPDGLTGHKIPLYGRIISVADTFDAMTSSRPYQETLTYEEARELIVGWSGTRYDPEVVKAFNASFEEIVTISNNIKTVMENAPL